MAAACCAALAHAAGPTALVGGQVDDLQAEFQGGDLAQLESIHRRKTGAMISVSLRLGGLVARPPAEQLAALETYGNKLGLAFQIVDDLLDLRGDEAPMGKRVGKGRRTRQADVSRPCWGWRRVSGARRRWSREACAAWSCSTSGVVLCSRWPAT